MVSRIFVTLLSPPRSHDIFFFVLLSFDKSLFTKKKCFLVCRKITFTMLIRPPTLVPLFPNIKKKIWKLMTRQLTIGTELVMLGHINLSSWHAYNSRESSKQEDYQIFTAGHIRYRNIYIYLWSFTFSP